MLGLTISLGLLRQLNGRYNGRIGDKRWDRDAYFGVNYAMETMRRGIAMHRLIVVNSHFATGISLCGRSNRTGKRTESSWSAHAIQGVQLSSLCDAPGVTPRIAFRIAGVFGRGARIAKRVTSTAPRTTCRSSKWVDVFLVEPAFFGKRGNSAVTRWPRHLRRDYRRNTAGGTVLAGRWCGATCRC